MKVKEAEVALNLTTHHKRACLSSSLQCRASDSLHLSAQSSSNTLILQAKKRSHTNLVQRDCHGRFPPVGSHDSVPCGSKAMGSGV